MNEKCGNCRFWKLWNGSGTGQCKRHAPKSKKDPSIYPPPLEWPIIEDDNWCGDWRSGGRMRLE